MCNLPFLTSNTLKNNVLSSNRQAAIVVLILEKYIALLFVDVKKIFFYNFGVKGLSPRADINISNTIKMNKKKKKYISSGKNLERKWKLASQKMFKLSPRADVNISNTTKKKKYFFWQKPWKKMETGIFRSETSLNQTLIHTT